MSSQPDLESMFQTSAVYDSADRYADNWRQNFALQYQPYLREGMTILDVGSGRAPAIPIEQRPASSRYIGLDISSEELELAPSGSYNERFVRDLKDHDPALDDQIDLAISWQVLEHVEPLGDAIENVHAYLKPGGHFVVLLSGRNSHFAVINRLMPEKIGVFAMKYLLKRPPESVFRAHYDACTHSGLAALLANWDHVEIKSLFRGARYLGFFPPAVAIYTKYEDWALRSGKHDLATHYVVIARK
jgi:SAM-dependent methyltransferase